MDTAEKAEILKEIDEEIAKEITATESEATPPARFDIAQETSPVQQTQTEEKPGEQKAPPSPLELEIEKANKRVRDTQAWGHQANQALERERQRADALERYILSQQKPVPETPAKPTISPDAEAFMSSPGFAEAVMAQANQLVQPILQQVKQVQANQISQVGMETRKQITTVHADADTVCRSPEWNEWMSQQPAYIQGAVHSPNPHDVNHVISQFKTYRKGVEGSLQTQIKSQERQNKLADASSLSGSSSFIPPRKNQDEDTSDFDKLSDTELKERSNRAKNNIRS